MTTPLSHSSYLRLWPCGWPPCLLELWQRDSMWPGVGQLSEVLLSLLQKRMGHTIVLTVSRTSRQELTLQNALTRRDADHLLVLLIQMRKPKDQEAKDIPTYCSLASSTQHVHSRTLVIPSSKFPHPACIFSVAGVTIYFLLTLQITVSSSLDTFPGSSPRMGGSFFPASCMFYL